MSKIPKFAQIFLMIIGLTVLASFMMGPYALYLLAPITIVVLVFFASKIFFVKTFPNAGVVFQAVFVSISTLLMASVVLWLISMYTDIL